MPDRNPDLSAIAGDIARAAKDAAYVAIGAGVLGFQRAQVRRHDLGKRVAKARAAMADDAGSRPAAATGPAGGVVGSLQGLVGTIHAVDKVVDDTVEGFFSWADATITPLEERLPDPARTVVRQAHVLALQVHDQARTARSQLRDRITGLAS